MWITIYLHNRILVFQKFYFLKDRWQCLDNREEKSSRGVALVAKFLDLNKPWSCKYRIKKRKAKKNLTCTTFLCMIALRNKTVP